jgi:hypothetical protein
MQRSVVGGMGCRAEATAGTEPGRFNGPYPVPPQRTRPGAVPAVIGGRGRLTRPGAVPAVARWGRP